MHLVSKKSQIVDVLDTQIHLKEGETIHTENSYKYSIDRFIQFDPLSIHLIVLRVDHDLIGFFK